jgi:hypothetical protein
LRAAAPRDGVGGLASGCWAIFLIIAGDRIRANRTAKVSAIPPKAKVDCASRCIGDIAGSAERRASLSEARLIVMMSSRLVFRV